VNAIRKSILIFLLRGFGKRMEAAEVLVVSGNWEFPGSLAPSDWEYPISAFRKRSSGPWGMMKKLLAKLVHRETPHRVYLSPRRDLTPVDNDEFDHTSSETVTHQSYRDPEVSEMLASCRRRHEECGLPPPTNAEICRMARIHPTDFSRLLHGKRKFSDITHNPTAQLNRLRRVCLDEKPMPPPDRKS